MGEEGEGFKKNIRTQFCFDQKPLLLTSRVATTRVVAG